MNGSSGGGMGGMGGGYGGYAQLASNVIGSVLQGVAAMKANKNMREALENDVNAQMRYQQQAQGIFNTQLAATGSEAAGRDLARGAAERQNAYQQIGAYPTQFNQPNQQSMSPTRDAALTDLLGNVRSRLGAYNDLTQNQWLANEAANRAMNQTASFAAGRHSLLPYQMYQAQHSRDALAAGGAFLSSLGSGNIDFNAGATGGRNEGIPISNLYGGQTGYTPTYAQSQAFGAGLGPVSEGYATYATAPRTMNDLYANQYGQYFTLY